MFLSHTGQGQNNSKNFAGYLKTELASRGIPTFMDITNLVAGSEWENEIKRYVETCSLFVCIISEQFYFRYWCMLELDLAFQKNRTILPVLYEETNRPDEAAFRAQLGFDDRVDENTLDRWWSNIVRLRGIQDIRRTNQRPGHESAFVCEVAARVQEVTRCYSCQ